MKPLTKCQPYLWRELDGTPSIVVIDTESGSYYRASEADARIAELEAERDAARADAERYRWIRSQGCSWETEAFISGLSPEQYDAAIDAARGKE